MADTASTPAQPPRPLRDEIAQYTVLGSVGGIFAIAILALALGKLDPEKALNLLLPVVSAWVGTVLAFYFGKDNFNAATQAVKNMAATMAGDQKLDAVRVTDPNVMIAVAKMEAVTIPDGKTEKDVSVGKDLLPKLVGPISRLPIFVGQTIKYLIHESMLYQYVAESAVKAPAGAQFDVNAATLADFLAYDTMRAVVTALAFVPETATLAQAKQAMTGVKGCQDVIVTKTGKADEPVMGWITNTTIEQLSKA